MIGTVKRCCYDCKDRYITIDDNGDWHTCHATCKDYQEYKATRAEEYKRRKHEADVNAYIGEQMLKNLRINEKNKWK